MKSIAEEIIKKLPKDFWDEQNSMTVVAIFLEIESWRNEEKSEGRDEKIKQMVQDLQEQYAGLSEAVIQTIIMCAFKAENVLMNWVLHY
jgi:hypothetical protein